MRGRGCSITRFEKNILLFVHGLCPAPAPIDKPSRSSKCRSNSKRIRYLLYSIHMVACFPWWFLRDLRLAVCFGARIAAVHVKQVKQSRVNSKTSKLTGPHGVDQLRGRLLVFPSPQIVKTEFIDASIIPVLVATGNNQGAAYAACCKITFWVSSCSQERINLVS
jgi:hypothetical protein